jgi:hypothetical protein
VTTNRGAGFSFQSNFPAEGFSFDRAIFDFTLSGLDQPVAAGVVTFGMSSITPVPLPAAAWLLLSALGGLGALSRRFENHVTDDDEDDQRCGTAGYPA